MAVVYGDLTEVQRILLNAGEAFPAGGPELTALAAIQKAVTLALDEKIGRRFGAVTATRTVRASGTSDLLILPNGNLTVTAVSSDGVVIAADLYERTFVALDGQAGALRSLTGGYWYGEFDVTGSWVDTAPLDLAGTQPTVPDDLTYAASYIIAKQYQRQNLAPTGLSGPDGTVLHVVNPWKDELVQAAIRRHRLSEVVI